MTYAQSKTPAAQRVKENQELQHYSHSDRRNQGISGRSRSVSIGVGGADRTPQNPTGCASTVPGGIITQLIEDAQVQLGKAQQEVEDCKERIARLKALLALEQQQNSEQ